MKNIHRIGESMKENRLNYKRKLEESESDQQMIIHKKAKCIKRPGVCSICGKKFSHDYTAKRHEKLVHQTH